MRRFAQTYVCAFCGKEGPRDLLCVPVAKIGMSRRATEFVALLVIALGSAIVGIALAWVVSWLI